ACLSVAEETDTQVAIHTDTLNEAGFVETSIAAFKGRTIHTYHTEGAGGGYAHGVPPPGSRDRRRSRLRRVADPAGNDCRGRYSPRPGCALDDVERLAG